MASGIRIRTSTKDDLTTVQAILKHPMDTGNSRDPETDNMIPAFFIEAVTIYHGDKVIMTCDWSRAVSKNPYLSLSFTGAKKGDTIRISWQDSSGNTESKEAVIQ
ncbi:MAG: thiosulfate oxidation carrier complex protein SoxZ [Gammaproteobacteria bacterium]|nr:MAG: thiosulfate oxidation carrier complex protein SoxZ [Gammaproteobacteria bacterium]